MDAHHELRLGMSLAAAFTLGALHVLEPVHGRSIVTAVAVGLTGSRTSVLKYALSVTVSHAVTTLLIAIAVALLGQMADTKVFALAVRLAGSLLTVYLGARMWRHAVHHGAYCYCPLHDRGEEAPALSLGVAGGLIPCLGSLALVMAAVGAGRFGAAVPLVLAFAAGLGVTLLVAALMSQALARAVQSRMEKAFRFSGHIAAAAILVAGVATLGYTLYAIALTQQQ